MEYSDLKWTKNTNGHIKGYMYYRDATGKRRQISKTSKKKKVREAKKEISEWAERVREQARTSLSLGPKHNGKTIEQVVREYLNFQLSRNILEKSSYVSQVSTCETNAFPYIGGIGFTELNKDAIEAWITDLNKKGLKQGTIHGVYAHIAKVYKYWYRQGELLYNPFEFVDTPAKSPCRKTYLDKDQTDGLVAVLNNQYEADSPLYVAVELALLAGLRRGEICGLRWYDVDLDRRMLSVSSSVGVANGTYTKGPKNRPSTRTFPIVPQLVEVLKVRKASVKKEYGTCEGSWFVCGKAVNYLPPTTLSKMFNEFVVANNLVDHYGNKLKLHSLRHNFATLGVRENVDIASLSRMMGHGSKSMTLDTYADSSPRAMKMAATQFATAFQNETDYFEVFEEEE